MFKVVKIENQWSQYCPSDYWSLGDVFEECVKIGGLSLYLFGLVAHGKENEQVTGSAVDLYHYPKERAFFELVERAATLDAIRSKRRFSSIRKGLQQSRVADELFPVSDDPKKWVYSKSNGIAIHTDFSKACSSAELELIERDRILRSWYGETLPSVKGGASCFEWQSSLSKYYDFQAYFFLDSSHDVKLGPHVAGVFGFPKNKKNFPFIHGFGACTTQSGALTHASGECLQRLGFLYGEEAPTDLSEYHPSAELHLNYVLMHQGEEAIQEWLAGSYYRPHEVQRSKKLQQILLFDLTPQNLKGKVSLIKAVSDQHIPLVFGRGHPRYKSIPLNSGQFIHPIA